MNAESPCLDLSEFPAGCECLAAITAVRYSYAGNVRRRRPFPRRRSRKASVISRASGICKTKVPTQLFPSCKLGITGVPVSYEVARGNLVETVLLIGLLFSRAYAS